jgi:rubrerythrin
MKKNLYESVLQAITELDLDNATAEDFLRIGISAEQSAINLYNRIANLLGKDSSVIGKLFSHTSQEEKVHVHEFQRLLFDIDPEEYSSAKEGTKETEEIISDAIDSLVVSDDFPVRQKEGIFIIEKGDKISIYKEEKTFRSETDYLKAVKKALMSYKPESGLPNYVLTDCQYNAYKIIEERILRGDYILVSDDPDLLDIEMSFDPEEYNEEDFSVSKINDIEKWFFESKFNPKIYFDEALEKAFNRNRRVNFSELTELAYRIYIKSLIEKAFLYLKKKTGFGIV